MADYVAISDTQVDPDAPLTSQLGYQFRDNPLAMFEGAVGAPRLFLAAVERVAAGDVVRSNQNVNISDTASGSDFAVMQAGTLRVKLTSVSSSTMIVTRYRNGVGTVVLSTGNVSSQVDVSVVPFDTITARMSVVSGTTSGTISWCTDGGNLWCANPSIDIGVTGNVST